MLWGISETVNARDFKPLPLCLAPWKHTSKDSWSSRNNRILHWDTPLHFLKTHFCLQSGFLSFRVLQKSLLVSYYCKLHCVQHPWKLTSMEFWSSRNNRKPLSHQECVLKKCCGVSQKWWMLELSNLSHCVQHPWNILVGITGALQMKESHFLSKNVFWENAVGYLRNSEC